MNSHPQPKRVLITGGAGFIGSSLTRYLVDQQRVSVLVVDKLTYAGNKASLRDVWDSSRFDFLRADVCDAKSLREAFVAFRPTAVMHLAAESHVDRSIDGPMPFVQTNVVGTCTLLQCALEYWQSLPATSQSDFRFHHISTDEVYGSLGPKGLFREDTRYDPHSPYSASKASSDHFVRAWHHTYGLPVIVTNCSNNYGPYQFPEKLIPLIILNAIEHQPLPVYGTGEHVRDWLFVEDHVRALWKVLTAGQVGATYNVGGDSQQTNLSVVQQTCRLLDRLHPHRQGLHEAAITHVVDRPGHDLRYAIDSSRIRSEMNWSPQHTFESGLEQTVRWYLDNEWWWRPIREQRYSGQRLGMAGGGQTQ